VLSQTGCLWKLRFIDLLGRTEPPFIGAALQRLSGAGLWRPICFATCLRQLQCVCVSTTVCKAN